MYIKICIWIQFFLRMFVKMFSKFNLRYVHIVTCFLTHIIIFLPSHLEFQKCHRTVSDY